MQIKPIKPIGISILKLNDGSECSINSNQKRILTFIALKTLSDPHPEHY